MVRIVGFHHPLKPLELHGFRISGGHLGGGARMIEQHESAMRLDAGFCIHFGRLEDEAEEGRRERGKETEERCTIP